MRRRDYIAGAAALGVFGAGAISVFGDDLLPAAVAGDEEVPAGTVGATVAPVTLPAIDAPGSAAAEVTVPARGRVTFVELFATWCTTCQANMSELRAAYDSVDGVQFVSVTNEPVGQTVDPEDVAQWWVEHDGAWPVAYDPELTLTRRLDGTEVPLAVVLDSENIIQWTSRGREQAESIVDAIQTAQ